jgi:hypothetical protein
MRYLLFILLFLSTARGFSQSSSIQIKAKSISPGDSFTVIIQKSVENFYQKKLYAGTASYTFNNISNGKWALKLDATGYYFPPTQVFDLTNKNISVDVQFTKITLANSIDYIYKWQDDSSFLGHAQQSYLNGDQDLKILGEAIKIPDDFSSVNLINTAGIALSNKITSWSSEDAFKLYQMVKRVPILNSNKELLSTNSVNVNSVWEITDEEIIDDISINEKNGIKYVTISRKAFVYATPLIAELDGIKGRFFSKRLYNAIVAFATNFGNNSDAISKIANISFGIRFLDPGDELKNLMNEDPSNFQSFSSFEKLTILSMFEELPDGMHALSNLKYIVRRIAGQDNPKYPSAAAIAWTGSKTIEFMQKAFNSSDYGSIQRLILHEKSHFLWAGLFEQKLKDDWANLGGWYVDPTSPSGWSTTNTTEFVSAYAHLKNPDEDMAESIATYVTNPNLILSRSIRKFEFIRDRVMHGTRYVSIIRKDLTFMVYNLYPDYNYPGKIEGVTVNVKGQPNEDKILTIEIKLHAIDSLKDGASYGFTRISSSIGTFFDMYLNPVNGNPFLLRGEIPITKYAKNGYWTVNQIMIADAAGNKRYENNNTFGLKIFINNPSEDLTPAKYNENTLKLSLGVSKFGGFQPYECLSCKDYQYVEAKFDITEKNLISYIGVNFAIPTNEKNVNRDLQFGVLSGDTNYVKRDLIIKDLWHVTYRYPIPEYYPAGYYKITQIYLKDEAQNEFRETFMNDTSGYKVQNNQQKHLRDSIYIKTNFPDYLPPILDVNAISIKATPTNPKSPDGETLFEMEFFVKDTSEFVGHEAGLQNGYYVLRDPQGKQFGFSMQADFEGGNNFYYLLEDPTGIPGSWKKYKVKTLLPKGSAPGLWGVESISLNDRAQNSKFFNFTEIVRFDIEESDTTLKVDPRIEILGKKVNSINVDSISVSISCKNCLNKIFRARFYSDMGGESVVKEGIMNSDSIVLINLKLSGVNDGTLFATVFILDTSRVLLGIGKATYTKDVKIPTSQKMQTNLSNFGKSNVDSLIIKIQSSELNGSYKVVLIQSTVKSAVNNFSDIKSQMYGGAKQFGIGDSLILTGTYTDGNFNISNSVLKNMLDGIISLKFYLYDSVGNEGSVIEKSLYKDTKNPELSLTRGSVSGLKLLYELTASEYISKSITKDFIIIGNGAIDSISQTSNTKYKIYLTKICNDTLLITFKSGTLIDTVGNKNIETNFKYIDTILPTAPLVRDTAYCQNGTVDTLKITPSSGSTILWYGSSEIGGTASSVAPKPITSTVGSIVYYMSQKVTATGCEGPRSKINVTINPLPTAPLVRDTAYCQNGTVDTLKITPSSGSTIVWYGSSEIGGTASSVAPKPITSTVGSIVYYMSQKVTATGCEGPRSKINVTINPLPTAPLVRDTAYCQNGTVDTLKITPSSGSTIVWYGSSEIGGTASSVAPKPITSTVGSIVYYMSQKVTATGCEGPRSKITVTINAIPSAPLLYRDSSNNLTANINGITWYKDGVKIPDTTQKIKPTSIGNYTATTTQNGCISSASANYYYLTTAYNNLSNDEYFTIFPNPTNRGINFKFNFRSTNEVFVNIIDLNGRTIMNNQKVRNGGSLNLGYIKGIYIIQCMDKSGKIFLTQKLIKN